MKPFVEIVSFLSMVSLVMCQLNNNFNNFPYFRGLISAIPGLNTSSEFAPTNSDRPIISISDGTLRGFVMESVSGRNIVAFQSIPFGKPPVGNLRFRDPVENEPWNGTLEAIQQSPVCIQYDPQQLEIVHGQEDCLYLNVYIPENPDSNVSRLPVMVFIYGGAFLLGSGGVYGPRYLLDRENVILVTVNYRTGPFGFLSTGDSASPGNQGLKDQVLALKWVNQNIAAFGGDPGSVTMFGQSAGAASVGLHIISPMSRGLFHRAIMQSGSALCYMAEGQPTATTTAKRVGEVFHCPVNSTLDMVECLRKVPAKDLAPVQLKFEEWLGYPIIWFSPTVEHDHLGAFMTKKPEEYYENGEAKNVTLIAGLTTDEMSLFVATLMYDLVHVADLNANWDWVGPIYLELNYGTRDVQVERVRTLWDFYMGDNKLTWETRMNFSQMISDRHVTECTLQAMQYHSMYTNASVYGYRFSYRGRYSYVQQSGRKPEDWGVVHGDELIYLLNNPNYYASLNTGDPEMEMSRMMTGIWSNFARYDKPYFPDVNGNSMSTEIWEPIQKSENVFSTLRFLDLNTNPKMIADPYVERYNFWRLNINPNP